MTRNDAMNFLSTVTMSNLKQRATRNGCSWGATLKIEGKAVMTVSNDGNGGPNRYHAAKGVAFADFRAMQTKLEKAASAVNGERFEAFDLVTCCMTPANNAADAAVQSIDLV